MRTPAQLLDGIRWLGRAGFLIQDRGLTVYIDPVGLPAGLPKADVVFLTHPHENHYSEMDVEAASAASTIVVGPRDCVGRFRLNQMPLRPGECREVLELWIKPVAAYCPKEGGRHSRDKDWLGFFVQFQDVSIYHPGDSALVPEMKDVHPDILLFPLRKNDALGRDEVRPFLENAKPKIVVPMHGSSAQDGEIFSELSKVCGELGIELKAHAASVPGGSHV